MKNIKIVVEGLNWRQGHEMALPDVLADQWVKEGKAVYIDRIAPETKALNADRVKNKSLQTASAGE